MHSVKMIGKKVTPAVLSIALLFGLALPAFTQLPAIEENSREIQVKYLDGDNEGLLFNLKYDNNSGEDFKLMVLSETGEVLFQKNYSGKKFRKRIKLARLTDTEDVTFLIRSPRQNMQLSRRVKVTSKVVDNTPLSDEED